MHQIDAKPIAKVEYAAYAAAVVTIVVFILQAFRVDLSSAVVDALTILVAAFIPVAVAYFKKPESRDIPVPDKASRSYPGID